MQKESKFKSLKTGNSIDLRSYQIESTDNPKLIRRVILSSQFEAVSKHDWDSKNNAGYTNANTQSVADKGRLGNQHKIGIQDSFNVSKGQSEAEKAWCKEKKEKESTKWKANTEILTFWMLA